NWITPSPSYSPVAENSTSSGSLHLPRLTDCLSCERIASGVNCPCNRCLAVYLKYNSSAASKSGIASRPRVYILSGRLGGEVYTDLTDRFSQTSFGVLQLPHNGIAFSAVRRRCHFTSVVNLNYGAIPPFNE